MNTIRHFAQSTDGLSSKSHEDSKRERFGAGIAMALYIHDVQNIANQKVYKADIASQHFCLLRSVLHYS